ncbi:uncharacterized protein TRUGW13939_09706 [Talaromyces rugulosus]|uniref:Uncharacterized protein n=1 Tax=Talaromyces rugulosus TaxID=121627 RepID=A0A7H8RAS9_TALRU|nr:uncharacterized protein TRUGW13939_09706 [Talaromyces rugulosus]QKX62545.1 hypothetical protein TRUGW13939_09706 [Talaromyces rugulosus]
MTQNAFDSRETSYDLQEDWNNFSQWQTEASTPVWQAPTPGFLSSAASNTSFTDHHSSLQAESQSQFSVPPLLQSDNFAVHYAVEWKATLNKRPVLHETEDSEMKPREFWESYLKPKIDKLLADNFPDKMLQIVNTNLMVLVDERGYRNKIKLIRQFPKLKIDWHVVESQLIEWAELMADISSEK